MTCQLLDYRSLIGFLFCLLFPLFGCINKQKETIKWSEDTRMVSCDSMAFSVDCWACIIQNPDFILTSVNFQ